MTFFSYLDASVPLARDGAHWAFAHHSTWVLDDLVMIQRMLPLQSREPGEVTIGRDPGASSLDRQRGEPRICNKVSSYVRALAQTHEHGPVVDRRTDETTTWVVA